MSAVTTAEIIADHKAGAFADYPRRRPSIAAIVDLYGCAPSTARRRVREVNRTLRHTRADIVAAMQGGHIVQPATIRDVAVYFGANLGTVRWQLFRLVDEGALSVTGGKGGPGGHFWFSLTPTTGADLVDLDARRPTTQGPVTCPLCKRAWLAVRPTGTPRVECPSCNQMTPCAATEPTTTTRS